MKTGNTDIVVQHEGRLIICPTPLGNLGDMTARSLDALRAADVVCAEDTRVTGRLLAAYGIEKRLERLDEAALSDRAAHIVDRVQAGEVVAYCSDAGMPGVSDPGLRLVRAARDAGASVEVLPGPTAAATAYVASGCTNSCFYFGGFFPRKQTQRGALLDSLRKLDAALVFYESPNRLVDALEALAQAFPQRDVTVCRELTKLHEEVVRDLAPCVYEMFAKRDCDEGVKGEIVIVVDGPSAAEVEGDRAHAEETARKRAVELAEQGMRGKQIAQVLAEEYDIARNTAYNLVLAMRADSDKV